MRHALPIERRHLPREQDAESPTYDRPAFPIKVIGEAESRSQVGAPVVLDRIIERSGGSKVELAKVCRGGQIHDADRHVACRLDHVVGVKVVTQPEVQDESGIDSEVILAEKAEL